jgi:hypothetical protein
LSPDFSFGGNKKQNRKPFIVEPGSGKQQKGDRSKKGWKASKPKMFFIKRRPTGHKFIPAKQLSIKKINLFLQNKFKQKKEVFIKVSKNQPSPDPKKKSTPKNHKHTTPLNFDMDLSFDSAAYESIKKWAEKYGKVILVERVTERYGEEIKTICLEFGVDYHVIVALCAHESGGDPNVVSSKGAIGVMQVMPGTGKTYGVADSSKLYDPHINFRVGIHYLADLMIDFNNIKDALYGYGWGGKGARDGLARGVKSDHIECIQQILYLIQVQENKK